MAYVRQHPDYPQFRVKKGIMPDFSGGNYEDQEKPNGVMNGVNRVFTLNHTPLQKSESIYKDGMKMARASSSDLLDGDYHINYPTATIVFSLKQVPQPNSIIRVGYKFMASG